MDKEEAIKILRELHDKVLFSERTALETLHPELKEPKDEKIRKALVRFHKGTIDIDGIKGEDILAWLEKQGEQKPIDKIQLGKKYKCIASPRYSTFRRGNIYKPVDNFLCNLMNLCYECFEPIEDSEQKSSDEDMKEALRTEYEKGRADAIAEMQKDWSEEDEKMIGRVRGIIEAYAFSQSAVDVNGDLCEKEYIDTDNWLKSLKERIGE